MARVATAVTAALLLLLAGAPPAAAAWLWPLHGKVITLYRNRSDPYARGQHRGIDIAGPVGARVVAATAGTVRFAGRVGYSGLTVGVRTADERYDTSYLHLSAIAVREGERVAAGQRLGAVGTTGRRSAVRPHLHFGVRDAGSRHGYHDPLDFLPPPARPRPAPRRTPTPVGAPARPSPVPHAVPVDAPRGVPGDLPLFRPAPTLRPAPRPQGVPVLAAHAAPEAGPAGAATRVRAPRRAQHQVHSDQRRPHAQPGHGPDVGWLAVCAGLLLTAGLLGAGSDRRRPASRGARRAPARWGALIRTLAGDG
jgi:Peptidase family M23